MKGSKFRKFETTQTLIGAKQQPSVQQGRRLDKAKKKLYKKAINLQISKTQFDFPNSLNFILI